MNNKWSWKIGQYSGIPVYLHWTFFFVPAVVAFMTLSNGDGLTGALKSVAFVLAIFGCVVLHEFGHALMARRFGVGTRDITLYPIGGVARLDRIPERPSHELLVALAGPAVNVVIALALFVGMVVAGGLGQPILQLTEDSFLVKLMVVNVALIVFNMLPAFPMDGGRVLRSILAMNMNYVRATDIAARIGQVCAVLLGIVGLFVFPNPMLIFIGAFVFFAARAEAYQARTRHAQNPFQSSHGPTPSTVQPAQSFQYQALRAESRLANVVDALVLSPQQSFPVMEGASFVGMLWKGDVLKAMAGGLGHLQVADVMQPR